MTREEFLKMSSEQYDKLVALKSEKSFYEFEKKYEKECIEFNKSVMENLISDPNSDRRKKKMSTRFGQIEISKTSKWSEGINGVKLALSLCGSA